MRALEKLVRRWPEILSILKGLGVDDAQGYHFSKPVKPEQPGTPIIFDGVL
jgi:EAL domain-containing protein (putative c-di-GMP-specific phosphodiesterase class I)